MEYSNFALLDASGVQNTVLVPLDMAWYVDFVCKIQREIQYKNSVCTKWNTYLMIAFEQRNKSTCMTTTIFFTNHNTICFFFLQKKSAKKIT